MALRMRIPHDGDGAITESSADLCLEINLISTPPYSLHEKHKKREDASSKLLQETTQFQSQEYKMLPSDSKSRPVWQNWCGCRIGSPYYALLKEPYVVGDASLSEAARQVAVCLARTVLVAPDDAETVGMLVWLFSPFPPL